MPLSSSYRPNLITHVPSSAVHKADIPTRSIPMSAFVGKADIG